MYDQDPINLSMSARLIESADGRIRTTRTLVRTYYRARASMMNHAGTTPHELRHVERKLEKALADHAHARQMRKRLD